MSKIAVIYKSTYGFTERYARYIAEELKADLLAANGLKPADLQAYDAIVYGGGLYAGGVNGLSSFIKNYAGIRNKALFLFTVGAADVNSQQNIDAIRGSLAKVLTPEMQEKIKIYHLRGGLDYTRMNAIHRTMMACMIKTLRKKEEEERTSEEKQMLATYGQKVDFTDPLTIAPLIEAVKEAL